MEELKQDALVEKLVVDPSKIPDVQVVVGFLGRSSEAGNWRLYFTLQLDSYVEFSEKDVLHTESLAPAQSPIGGTVVWLNENTVLRHTRTGTRQAQAEFVQGDIMSSFMAGPGMQEMTPGRLVGHAPPVQSFLCPTFTCQSLGPWGCRSLILC